MSATKYPWFSRKSKPCIQDNITSKRYVQNALRTWLSRSISKDAIIYAVISLIVSILFSWIAIHIANIHRKSEEEITDRRRMAEAYMKFGESIGSFRAATARIKTGCQEDLDQFCYDMLWDSVLEIDSAMTKIGSQLAPFIEYASRKETDRASPHPKLEEMIRQVWEDCFATPYFIGTNSTPALSTLISEIFKSGLCTPEKCNPDAAEAASSIVHRIWSGSCIDKNPDNYPLYWLDDNLQVLYSNRIMDNTRGARLFWNDALARVRFLALPGFTFSGLSSGPSSQKSHTHTQEANGSEEKLSCEKAVQPVSPEMQANEAQGILSAQGPCSRRSAPNICYSNVRNRMKLFWDYHKDSKTALIKLSIFIDNYKFLAKRREDHLRARKMVRRTGRVDGLDREIILADADLNDVATCCFIRGLAAKKLQRFEEARDAFRAATEFTYARALTEDGISFWSPAEAAHKELMEIEESSIKIWAHK